MGSITQIMKSVCEKMGVEITTNASVNKILVQNNSATGVLLEDGSKILSKKVISNLNPKLLFKNLVNHDDVDKEYLRKILHYKCGSGTFRMNVALSELPNFKCLPSSGVSDHHKSGIIFAPTLSYMDKAFTDAKKYGWSKNPIVEMLIPSTVDSSLWHLKENMLRLCFVNNLLQIYQIIDHGMMKEIKPLQQSLIQ